MSRGAPGFTRRIGCAADGRAGRALWKATGLSHEPNEIFGQGPLVLVGCFWCHVPSWPGTVATFGHHRVDKYAVDCFGMGGVGWGWWHSLNLNTWWMLRKSVCLVIAHMVDATQVCLSCHCTHGGCYASLFVLSLHTWWMLCNSVCLELARGWGGDDDILWTWTHGGRYATLFVLNLHVGWGGVGMMTFFELEHMVDATQLCLSCHCTHGGCYTSLFVLSLHTWWMLRNFVCLELARGVGWGGDNDILWAWTHGGCYATLFVLNLHVGWGGAGMMTFFELEHMVDATQLCLSWTCGWGGVGMMTFFELEHMVDATQLCLSCHCTHGGCYASLFVLSLHTWWMLRNSVCLELARGVGWGGYDDILWTWTHGGCYATLFVLSLHTWWMLHKSVCLVIAHMVDWWMLRNFVCLELARGVGWGGDDDILWTWTHGGCYATLFVLSLHTWWMLRNCVCFVIAHMVDATPQCLSCQSVPCHLMVSDFFRSCSHQSV